MKRIVMMTAMLAALSGCHGAAGAAAVADEDSAPRGNRIANDIKDNVYKTADRVKKWMERTPEKPRQPVAASYCYQTFQDILCYRQPMPGWEARLVGYQGTYAQPPGAAVMQTMPTRVTSAAMEPENRAASAKPLVVGAAIDPKADEKTSDTGEIKAITIDAAHESLPDPTLAPQL